MQSANSQIELKPIVPVRMVEEKGKHIYLADKDGVSKRFGSVTEFLGVIAKPALVPWAKRETAASIEAELNKRLNGSDSAEITLNKSWIQGIIAAAKKKPDQIKEEAADFGTQVHAHIDSIIHGREPATIREAIEGPVQSFRDWWMKSGIRLVLGDTPVASLTYEYGGSLDAVGVRGNELVILDWKTSSAIYGEYALQTAAYAQAFYETYGLSCGSAIVVRFGKKPPIDFEAREVFDLTQSLQAFLAAKTLKDLLAKPQFMPI